MNSGICGLSADKLLYTVHSYTSHCKNNEALWQGIIKISEISYYEKKGKSWAFVLKKVLRTHMHFGNLA